MKLPKYKFDRFMMRSVLKLNNRIEKLLKKNK